jgi:hypothetical protein
MKTNKLLLGLCLTLSACVGTNSVRTSNDTAIVQASAAPICGGIGAAKVAQRQAAIETLKDGYDRYIIVGAAAADNVHVYQTPGTYNTTATVNGSFIAATTTYQPGMPIVAGHHDQSFAVKMFHEGEPGAENALPARSVLGPKWQEIIKSGSLTTCFDNG